MGLQLKDGFNSVDKDLYSFLEIFKKTFLSQLLKEDLRLINNGYKTCRKTEAGLVTISIYFAIYRLVLQSNCNSLEPRLGESGKA